MSALDPILTNHTVRKSNLEKSLSICCQKMRRRKYPCEVLTYVNDTGLPQYLDNERVDKWWSQYCLKSKYPSLTKVGLSSSLYSIDPSLSLQTLKCLEKLQSRHQECKSQCSMQYKLSNMNCSPTTPQLCFTLKERDPRRIQWISNCAETSEILSNTKEA